MMIKNIHQYWVYMVTKADGNGLYIGVTNNLERGVQGHGSGSITGFGQRCHCSKLV